MAQEPKVKTIDEAIAESTPGVVEALKPLQDILGAGQKIGVDIFVIQDKSVKIRMPDEEKAKLGPDIWEQVWSKRRWGPRFRSILKVFQEKGNPPLTDEEIEEESGYRFYGGEDLNQPLRKSGIPVVLRVSGQRKVEGERRPRRTFQLYLR